MTTADTQHENVMGVVTDNNVAILHKHYPERGGAERVADELARTFDAPVYTAYDNDSSADDVDVHEFYDDAFASSLMQKESWAGWLYRDLYYYLHNEYLPELREYDAVIQSGAAVSWYVPPDDQALVRYVHSPPRTPYDRFEQSMPGKIQRAYSYVVRALYPQTGSYPDIVVANSDLTARRVRRYIGRDNVRVVYPPVSLPRTVPDTGTEDYYVALSRLAPNKGFDVIIDAFRDTAHELRIVGDGRERDRLEHRAADADNIRFEGYIDAGEKARVLSEAKALVYAAENEDFGLVPMEAFACGTPVIGVDEGFTQHQIRDGHSGIVFDRDPAALRAAIERFEQVGVSASAAELRDAAQTCAPQRFRDRMRDIVDEAIGRANLQSVDLWGSKTQLTDMNTAAPDGGEQT